MLELQYGKSQKMLRFFHPHVLHIILLTCSASNSVTFLIPKLQIWSKISSLVLYVGEGSFDSLAFKKVLLISPKWVMLVKEHSVAIKPELFSSIL